MQEGEKAILGETATALSTGEATSGAGVEDDLMSLLDDGMLGVEGAADGDGEPDVAAQESIPLARPARPEESTPGGDAPQEPPPLAETSEPAVEEGKTARSARPKARPAAESASSIPTASMLHAEARSSIPKYFALVGVVLLVAGAAVWWFFFQPTPAAGQSSPGGPQSPPAASIPGAPAATDAPGPIPTPIGGQSKKPAAQAASDAPPAAAAAAGTLPGVAPPKSGSGAALDVLSPQEVRTKVNSHLAKGRQLLAREDWHGAAGEMRAVMAIDPFNLEIRDLAEKANVAIAAEEKIQDQLNEIIVLFDAKEFQKALWKLYRLPDDPFQIALVYTLP